MSNLTQLFDLLTLHGGTLSYNALAGMMGTNVRVVAAVVMQAKIAGIAHNLNRRGSNLGGLAQLYPDAKSPTSPREEYQRSEGRGPEALALLADHPEGLTQIRLGYLSAWSHATVCRCMIALEMSGQVNVTGGTAQRPKTYTLPADSAPRPAPAYGDHHGPYARQGKTLALLAEHPDGLNLLMIAGKLSISTRTLRPTIHALLAQGKLIETIRNLSGHRTYALPQDVLAALPLAPAQVPVRADLTGELGTARKLVDRLTIKSARGLACAGNYKLSKAEDLYAQLVAGDWL